MQKIGLASVSMDDIKMMELAIIEAKKALPSDVPVGAVIVDENGVVIASSYNQREKTLNATHHGEVNVIQQACERLKTRRLNDCTIYVTLEPCVMCAGALIQAQISKVVFGAFDKQYGAAGSIYNFFSDPRLNHNAEVIGGVLQDECGSLLNDFFASKRD